MSRSSTASLPVPQPAALHAFAVFDLTPSSGASEEGERRAVIERYCWPLLALAATHGPLGVVCTGATLEDIEESDPACIRRLRELIATGKIELIGSGYAAIAGIFVPARLNARNVALGNRVYRDLLNARPTIAFPGEGAVSAGHAGHYLDAGYSTLLIESASHRLAQPARHDNEDDPPEAALAADGRSISLLWTHADVGDTLASYVSGDLTLDDFVDAMAAGHGKSAGALCLYVSGKDIFGPGPQRRRDEETLSAESEWVRIATAFSLIEAVDGVVLTSPSAALAARGRAKNAALALETLSHLGSPGPRGQRSRSGWAVSGRDNIAINAACERIYKRLCAKNASDSEWKRLCRLYSGEARGTLLDTRWQAYCEALIRAEAALGSHPPSAPSATSGIATQQRYIDIATPCLRAQLDRRKGLALCALAFEDEEVPWIGTIFGAGRSQAAACTGACVYREPGEARVDDLDWSDTTIGSNAAGDTLVCGVIETALGPVEKRMRFHASVPRVDFDIRFDWRHWGKGSLRLGHVTLLRDGWNWRQLALTTHHGGFAAERLALHGRSIAHGAAVSFFASASGGIGMTEGFAELSDGRRRLRLEIDRETAPLLGLLTYREGESEPFCQLSLSMLEIDETRRPCAYAAAHGAEPCRRARFSITGALLRACCD